MPYILNVRLFQLQIPNKYQENQLRHPLNRDLSSTITLSLFCNNWGLNLSRLNTAESTIPSRTSFDQNICCSCARMHQFSIENVIVGCLKRKKSLYSFFIISLAASMRRGRGVLKRLVMWAADGNIIFIQRKSNQGTLFDQLLSKNLFDGFEINKQHLSCSECFNQLAFQHLNCKNSQQPLPIVLIRLIQDDTVRLRARCTQQQYLSPKKKAVSFNLKSRAEYLCRSRKIDFRGGNCRIKKPCPYVGKLEFKPLNWVWLQLDLTTDSSPVVL